MNIKKKILGLGSYLLLGLIACKHPPIVTPETCTNLPSVVSYNSNIQPVFNQYCTSGCHSGSGSSGASLNLLAINSYDQLFARKDVDTLTPGNSILYLQMTSVGTPMPPTGKLDDCTLQLILKWIQQGAKNN